MIVLNKYLKNQVDLVHHTVYLTSEQRQKTKQKIIVDDLIIKLDLDRGTVIKDHDLLTNEDEKIVVQIKAKPENVTTVTADNPLDLLRASYHLGNRHVSLEIRENYLRFSSDHVLESMLVKLGLDVKREIAPFCPEVGAYHHH